MPMYRHIRCCSYNLEFSIALKCYLICDTTRKRKNTLNHSHTTLKDRKQMWWKMTRTSLYKIRLKLQQIRLKFFSILIWTWFVSVFMVLHFNTLVALVEWQFRNICQNEKTDLVYFMHIFLWFKQRTAIYSDIFQLKDDKYRESLKKVDFPWN